LLAEWNLPIIMVIKVLQFIILRSPLSSLVLVFWNQSIHIILWSCRAASQFIYHFWMVLPESRFTTIFMKIYFQFGSDFMTHNLAIFCALRLILIFIFFVMVIISIFTLLALLFISEDDLIVHIVMAKSLLRTLIMWFNLFDLIDKLIVIYFSQLLLYCRVVISCIILISI